MLLFICAIFLCIATSVAASDKSVDHINRDALRQAIYDGHVHKVEAIYDTAQSQFLAGDITASEMRELFEIFVMSDPRVSAFS
ncbi:MAG: hypothetical protein P1U83_06665 [Roseovarius sp.]|nr:hypothetical protein [Roseovarius sp.]